MEIKYEGANRKSGFYPLVKEAPINARFDTQNTLILEIKHIRVDQKGGEYDVRVTLTPEDVGKIVEAFYKQALTKSK